MVTVSQKQKLCHHLPHVDSNLYDFLCVEHKRKYLEEFGKPNSFGEHCFLSIQLKSIGTQNCFVTNILQNNILRSAEESKLYRSETT